MPHNINFHSATRALGGGGLTLVNPGEQVVLRFKATNLGFRLVRDPRAWAPLAVLRDRFTRKLASAL
jgi:hypothetical protein